MREAQRSVYGSYSTYRADWLPICHVMRGVLWCGMCIWVLPPLTAGWALERLEVAVLESMRPQVLPLSCTITTALQHKAHSTEHDRAAHSTRYTSHITQYSQPSTHI